MSFHDTQNPNGGVPMERVIDQPTPENHLLERILATENMELAWKRVRANKGAPGVDGITIDDFPDKFRPLWGDIRASLATGTYQPKPVLRVEIPKPTGGTRPLGIPIVLDRLIQQSIAQVLTPIFDPGFSGSSFGFRPGRSAHDAVRQLREYLQQGYRIAVDIDLAKFFDTVNHDLLMTMVGRKVRDKRVLALIGRYLRARVEVDGRLEKTRKGVPQGGPLSPLLANILLDNLDKELEKRGHKFVRYADDFVILVKSERAGERVMGSVRHYLTRQLKLTVNEDKSNVARSGDISFLGFVFKGTKILWSDTAYREFRRRVRKYTGRSWFVSMEYRLNKLSTYLRGWMGYFGIAEAYRDIPEIDGWIRRRVRLCYWKQWRWCRTKIRNLLKLGVQLGTSIRAGLNRNGPWAMSRRLAAQHGMTNQWLKDQGLVSVKELWVKIHHPATAR
ncbi:group II intron reverse transcriptase/maturase [Geobacter hydrogenophilus]|uniref:RNA-directed DNA polymerase n=1 Tax=Geobacter hydrogenophilus TaxID=40983 RepID=A0A9W6LDU1_9BACT|nr:group II intron reverse transcriptase/maturase [Geobacter hydrogenophilus]MBT0895624.1 group II intron reverse transcriptase/maturase [Geobacter hydrogenophilus]GLI39315.1 group II intron reverse transcriptase/maturase [Geobacter hydrogenophilus]